MNLNELRVVGMEESIPGETIGSKIEPKDSPNHHLGAFMDYVAKSGNGAKKNTSRIELILCVNAKINQIYFLMQTLILSIMLK